MDTRMTPSKPSSYYSLIAQSILLYRKSFYRVYLLSLLVALTVFIPRILSDVIGQDIFLNVSLFSSSRFWLLVIDLVSMIFIVGVLWRTRCTIKGVNEPLITDLNIGLHKIFSIFVASIIQSIILSASVLIIYGLQFVLYKHDLLTHENTTGLIFLISTFSLQLFLILYVFTLFIFVVPLIAIENKGILSALEKSILLTWNHWWRVISVQITPWIVYIVVLLFLKDFLQINIHTYFAGHHPHSFAGTAINLILFSLYIPWVAAVMLVQIQDLELRKKNNEEQLPLT